jgi:hypothetical protein
MSRAVLIAVLLGVAPPACDKLLAKKQAEPLQIPDPPPPPAPAPPPPPVWAPPEPAGGVVAPTPEASASAAPPANPELAKAHAAAEAKDWKKVKQLLEKKARAGKASPEEAKLAFDACMTLKEKACADAVKAKYPQVER